jgi:hypothetical protein
MIYFLKKYAYVEQIAANRYIASYLGITPTEFKQVTGHLGKRLAFYRYAWNLTFGKLYVKLLFHFFV